jgi:hypothetical protein
VHRCEIREKSTFFRFASFRSEAKMTAHPTNNSPVSVTVVGSSLLLSHTFFISCSSLRKCRNCNNKQS